LNIFSQLNQTWAFCCCTLLATVNFFFLLTLFYIVLCWGSNDTIDKGDEIGCIASTLYSLMSLLICIVIFEMKKKTLGSFGEGSLWVLSSFPFWFRLNKYLKGMWETNSFLHWETRQTLQVGVVTFVWYVWAHWPWSLLGAFWVVAHISQLASSTSSPTTSNQGIRIIPTLYALHHYLSLSKLVECMGVYIIKQSAQVMCYNLFYKWLLHIHT
jgi:hypothetical protein